MRSDIQCLLILPPIQTHKLRRVTIIDRDETATPFVVSVFLLELVLADAVSSPSLGGINGGRPVNAPLLNLNN
jgi:hypothetical protein